MRSRVLPAIVLLVPVLLMAQSRKELSKTKPKPATITIDSSVFRPGTFWIDPPKEIIGFFDDFKGLQKSNFALYQGDTKLQLEDPAYIYLEGIGNRLIYPGEHIAIKLHEDQLSVVIYAPGDPNRSMDILMSSAFDDSCSAIARLFHRTPWDLQITSATDLLQFEDQILSENTAACLRMRVVAASLLGSYNAGNNVRDYINNKIVDDSLGTILNLLESRHESYFRFGLMQKRLLDLKESLARAWENKSARYSVRLTDRLYELVLKVKKVEADTQSEKLFYARKELIDSFFTGYPRAFLWSQMVYNYIKQRVPLPVEELASYKQDTCNNEYRKIIEDRLAINERFNDPKGNTGNSRTVNMVSDKQTTIEAVLKKYKGSLVLVDFWGSWCGYCRMEFPSSRELDKELNGKVKFIYVSVDLSVGKWKNASNIEKLDPQNSFLLLDAYRSDFSNRFAVQYVPRYILFGKNGAVINADAPRPSDKKLKALIEQHL